MPIPFIVGVTGHRDIIVNDRSLLEEAVRLQLKQLKDRCPHTPIWMVNSLAEGADQLCAQIALKLGLELIVVLPMELSDYEKDFHDDALIRLHELLEKAKEVFIAPDKECKSIKDRDYWYRQAGIYIASSSHLLLALWDGDNEHVSSCGTAAVVDFMLKPTYDCEDSPFKAMGDGVVLHIKTPRMSNPIMDGAYSIRLLENHSGSLYTTLLLTDRFNMDSTDLTTTDLSIPLNKETVSKMGPISLNLYHHFQQADALSVIYRDKYMQSVLKISIFGMLMVFTFLLYNQLNLSIFLVIYGTLFLAMFFVFKVNSKSQFQIRYLEYRALAESIRIQLYLQLLGVHQNLCESLIWPNHPKNVWIRDAVTALLVGIPEKAVLTEDELKTSWIVDQLAYQQRKRKEDVRKESLQSITKKVMLVTSIFSFLLVCFLRIFNNPRMMDSVETMVLQRVFDVFMGSVTAATAFTGNYYGKLSLKRKISDHDKMIALYKVALELYDHPEIKREKLFISLAKESMIENGDWLTYCRDETPSVFL